MTSRVFFSWQSDLPQANTTTAIRDALKAARRALEKKYATVGLLIELDEATRAETGSPHIPDTILEKIAKCDIFVADLSVINGQFAAGARLTPNPNVLFELGHAVGQIGWKRVVLLFNEEFGAVKDLPFDLDKRRVSKFRLIKGGSRGGLDALVTTAIEAVYMGAPPKADYGFDAEKTKRSRDLRTMSDLLAHVPWTTLRSHCESAPKITTGEFLHFFDRFYDFVNAPTFSLYDPKLKDLVLNLAKHWRKTTSHASRYERLPGDKHYTFTYSSNAKQRAREEAEWECMIKELYDLEAAMKDLIAYLKAVYLEIDLEERETAALALYR